MLTLVCGTTTSPHIRFASQIMKKKFEHATLIQFGKRITRLRQRRAMSQEELATKAGVHRTYIGMIERGEKNITILTLLRVTTALDVKLSDLLKGFEDE